MSQSPLGLPSLPPIGLNRSSGLRRARETVVIGTLICCGLFSLLTTVTIIVVLTKETASFFGRDEVTVLDFITGTEWNPLLGNEKHFGIWPLICGTMLITVIAMGLALPLGLITAIWLSEYAHPTLRAVVKPVLEVLAGIPTVVFGFFALTVITPNLKWLHEGFGVYNAMSAGLAVGIMTLPIVTSLTEDALRAVPKSLREASYGVGATRFETSIKVVVPAALSGIVAAFLLAIARAVGETMIVALAAGSTAQLTINPQDSVQPMTGFIVQMVKGDVSNFDIEYYSLYAVAATLFIMTFLLTVVGHKIRVRFRQEYQ